MRTIKALVTSLLEFLEDYFCESYEDEEID